MPRRSRGRADTPPPRSFPLGFAAFALLAPGVPLASVIAATPWSPWGLDTFLVGMIPSVLGGVVLGIPLAAGLKRRPFWWVCWFFYVGVILLTAWALALVAAAAYPLGWVGLRAGADPGLGSLGWWGFIMLAALAIPAVFLIRALRHPYWHPWSPEAAARA